MEMLERKVNNKKFTTDTRAGSFEQNQSNYTFWTCSYKHLTYLAEKPSLLCENINIFAKFVASCLEKLNHDQFKKLISMVNISPGTENKVFLFTVILFTSGRVCQRLTF